jgi:hypothetical protein
MRKRITFISPPDSSLHPDQFRLENDTLHLKSLYAAREDRLTFGYQELPQEVSLSCFYSLD